MRGPVARTVQEVQHLPRVGQRHHQRMVTPLLLVVHADAVFALAARLDQRAVRFDDRPLEELVRLLLPDFEPRLVEGFHQRKHIPRAEASAEVGRRRRIGDPLGSEGIEIRLVAPAQFEVLQTGAARQQVVGHVEDMVGFAVRQVELEDRTDPIDAVGHAQLPHQLLHDPQPAGGNRLRPIGQFVADGRRINHRRLAVPVGFVDALVRPTLPRFELPADPAVHLKTSLRCDALPLSLRESTENRSRIPTHTIHRKWIYAGSRTSH